MAADLEKWAAIEKQFLVDDIKWLKAGAKLSPSGDDISVKKLAELEARLEHARKALGNA